MISVSPQTSSVARAGSIARKASTATWTPLCGITDPITPNRSGGAGARRGPLAAAASTP